MSWTDAEAAVDLASAGLEFLESMRGGVILPFPPNRSSCATCLPEHGRFDATPEEIIQVDASDMAAKVDAG